MIPCIAWEDTGAGAVERVWLTVKSATTDPIATFGRIGSYPGERDVWLAVRFALFASVIGWSPLLLLTPCLLVFPLAMADAMPHDLRALGVGAFCAIIAAIPALTVLGSLVTDLLHASIFHGISRLLGGKGEWRASLHTILYTATIRVWMCPAFFLAFVPFLSVIVQFGVRAGSMIWTGVACYGAARSVHRLDDSSAILVGIFTPMLAFALSSFLIVMIVLGIAAAVIGTAGVMQHLEGLGR